VTLAWSRYGKARIRLVKIRRAHPLHEIADLTLDVQLEGAFEPVYVDGDSALCLATDTMKNTVYAMAREDDLARIEPFGLRLAAHFAAQPAVSRARISIVEHRWDRLVVEEGRPHPHAFVQPGGEQWTAVVTRDGRGSEVRSGLTNLVLLKTTDSAFTGFPKDRFTSLPDTTDRILATSVTASWRYQSEFADFGARDAIRQALVDTFAAHDSRSVQHTQYAMGRRALAACADISEITLAMPNRHHLPVNLAPFGLDNPNEIFVATEQPFGLIESTVTRD
jgi:urate oxidase